MYNLMVNMTKFRTKTKYLDLTYYTSVRRHNGSMEIWDSLDSRLEIRIHVHSRSRLSIHTLATKYDQLLATIDCDTTK